MASSMGPGKLVTDGLVLHLDAGNTKSYPGSGTVWTDLSSTAITGSLTNGPTFSSINNGSIVFDGSNDYVITQYTENPRYFTFECCFSLNSVSSLPRVIIGKYKTSGDDYWMGVYTNSKIVFSTTGNVLDSNVTAVISTNYHVACVMGQNSKEIYLNGVLTNSSSSMATSPSGSLVLGAFGENVTFNSAVNIQYFRFYNRALSANEVFQNYEATRERFNRPTIVTDDDARNFLNSANISSETQQRAVNDLVVDMKNVGLWGKMKAIYPFVGGTATTHKWNLKDPRDVDAAFRLQFNGGWTHSSNGADPNGTTAYADTFLTPSSTLLQNSTHISFYSRENSTGTEVEMGVSNSITQANRLFIEINTSGTTYISVNDTFSTTYVSFADTDARGYYIGTRTSSNSKTAFRNNIAKGTSNAVSDGLANWSIYIGAYHSYTGIPIQYYSTKQCAFATIGDGLTDTDAANLYTIVQKYQTTLGRQV